MRNAGKLVPPFGASKGGEDATVEYARLALGAEETSVCGHSHCRAMQGLMANEPLKGMPAASW